MSGTGQKKQIGIISGQYQKKLRQKLPAEKKGELEEY